MPQPAANRVEPIRLISLARDMLARAKDDSVAITYLDLALDVLSDGPDAAEITPDRGADRG